MTNREEALQIAENTIEQIENGGISPDTQDLLSYAIALLLADIGERLQGIEDTLDRMHEYHTGMDVKGM